VQGGSTVNLSECLPILQAVETVIGHRPHIQSVRRWIKKGVRGVRLQASFVAGKYLTSESAVREFIAATTEARLEIDEPPKLNLAKPVKSARVDAAVKEFERMTKPGKARA
jgi:hypothetical protein